MATLKGLQMISDDIQSFSAYAQETISGGQFVKAVGDDDVVAGGSVDSYVTNDIAVGLMNAGADGELVVGIALETATSGNPITIGTEGLFVLAAANAAVAVGKAIQPGSDTTVFANVVQEVEDGNEEFAIGKALTGASASGKYIIALINV